VTSRFAVDEGLMPRMLESVLVIDDPSQMAKKRRAVVKEEGIQSIVSVPIKTSESTLGIIGLLSHEPRTFAPEELELLATIGNQVGVAIDRANLQAQELRVAILEERQAMAWHMHDDIAQTLGYLGLQVDGVMSSSSLAQNAGVQTALEELRRDIEDAYERVRSSIIRLQGDIPNHFDLGAALQSSSKEFEEQTGCQVELEMDREQLPHLSAAVAMQATYIVHEALTNVRKHSNADAVRLICQGLEDDIIEIVIQDNGQGFDLDDKQRSTWEGFGLRFMRERAEQVGGSLRINSQPGQGVQVAIRLPSG
jgi:two-component system nitrate/nitrite sensor histidine kinase NarX